MEFVPARGFVFMAGYTTGLDTGLVARPTVAEMVRENRMGFFWMTAGTMLLLTIALVSLLAVLQAYRDGRGAPRSRQNWIAMSMWALVAVLALASGASMAWATDHYFGTPTPSW